MNMLHMRTSPMQPAVKLHAKKTRCSMLKSGCACSFLYEHRDLLGDLGNKTAKELGWAKLNVITVKADTAALEALALMADKDIAGVGVVSDEGALIGNFSFSDLRQATIQVL